MTVMQRFPVRQKLSKSYPATRFSSHVVASFHSLAILFFPYLHDAEMFQTDFILKLLKLILNNSAVADIYMRSGTV